MSTSGMPITLNAGQLTRILEGTDTLNVSAIARTTNGHITIAAPVDYEVQIGTADEVTRILGDLNVDGAEIVTGGTTFNGNVSLGDGSGDTITIGGDASDSVSLEADMSIADDIDVRFDRVNGTGVLVLPSASTGEAGAIRITAGGAFEWWNGDSFVAAGTSSGTSLQESYDLGQDIAVTAAKGTVAISVADDEAVDALTVTQSNNDGTNVALSIVSQNTDYPSVLLSGANRGIAARSAAALTTTLAVGAYKFADDENAVLTVQTQNAGFTGGANVLNLWGLNEGATGTGVVNIDSKTTINIGCDPVWDYTQGSVNICTDSNATVRELTLGHITKANITLTGAEIDIDAGAAGLLLDSTTLSIDSVDTTNMTMTANDAGDKTFAIVALNAGDGIGILSLYGDSLVAYDAYKAGSSYASDLVLSDVSAEWTLFDTNFTEVSVLNAINQAYNASVWSSVADVALAAGDVVAVDDGSAAGKLGKSDADGAGTTKFAVGVCVVAGAGGATVYCKSVGNVNVASNASAQWTNGAPVYMDTNAGKATTVVPTGTGTAVQRIGTALGDSESVTSHAIILTIGDAVIL